MQNTSLSETLSSGWANRFVSGMTKAVSGKVYLGQNHKTASYPRNPSLWCADVVNELTAVSPWNSEHLNRVGGTLITKRHIITSAHAALSISSVPLTVRFVDADSNVHTRTIVGCKTSAEWSRRSNRSDFRIYTLDSDLPDSIKPCKLMPSNWEDYLPDLNKSRPPQLVFDQEEKALVADLRKIDAKLSYGAYPVQDDRAIFSESLIGGDSGNPAFLIVDPDPDDSNVSSELVLNYVLTFGGTGSGTSLANCIPLLNATIAGSDADASDRSDTTTINTGYTVTEADFSYYTKYSKQVSAGVTSSNSSTTTQQVSAGVTSSNSSTTTQQVSAGATSSNSSTTTQQVSVGVTSSNSSTATQLVSVGVTSASEETHTEEEDPSTEGLDIGLDKDVIYLISVVLLILYLVLEWAGFFPT